jgi:hypothetical protein
MKLEAELTEHADDNHGLGLKNSKFDELVKDPHLFEEEKNLRI